MWEGLSLEFVGWGLRGEGWDGGLLSCSWILGVEVVVDVKEEEEVEEEVVGEKKKMGGGGERL